MEIPLKLLMSLMRIVHYCFCYILSRSGVRRRLVIKRTSYTREIGKIKYYVLRVDENVDYCNILSREKI